jgi:dihydroxyacetone kinase
MEKPMRKIINDPADFVDEVVDGILRAHSGQLRSASRDKRALVRQGDDESESNRVRIVTGGGSGHLPLFLGYVGQGLATGAAIGNVFSSPSPDQVLAATQVKIARRGALYLYGNYGGDIYNFSVAAELAKAAGVEVTTVLGKDDLLSASEDRAAQRRGVAGLVFAYKTAGASAWRGDDLESVTAIAQRTVDSTRTVGVGLSPTILPIVGKPTFEIADGMMEIGVGIHGESGLGATPLEEADSIGDRFFAHLDAELAFAHPQRVAVLVNGLGATPLEELYLLYRRVTELIEAAGSAVVWNYIGEYATSLEMAGASVSVLSLDDELEELLLAPASSPFYRDGSRVTVGSAAGEVEADEIGDVEVTRTGRDSALRRVLRDVASSMPAHAEELGELDSALGDGDLGITVSEGANAIRELLDGLPDDVAARDLLRQVGQAFSSANPSTFAALVGMAVIEASSLVPGDRSSMSLEQGLLFGRAVAASVESRGGAKLGDKTLLDVLVPVLGELEAGSTMPAVREFIAQQVETVAHLQSNVGRAAWHRERSVGRKDPGSVAIQRFFEELANALHAS